MIAFFAVAPLRPVGRTLLFLACLLCSISAMVPENVYTESVTWEKMSGRPIHGLAGEYIEFQKVKLQLDRRRNEGLAQAYIVKVERAVRLEIVQAIKSLFADVWMQYLPHDCYITVLTEDIALQVVSLNGTEVFLLPAEMKLSSAILLARSNETEPASETSGQIAAAAKSGRRNRKMWGESGQRRAGQGVTTVSSILTVIVGRIGVTRVDDAWWEALTADGLNEDVEVAPALLL